ncbi:MAG: C1 family peptidase [Deltaproteobacteria bacterium]|nr:C1 family peptidase [Deltaproteobacteria bacterium]
MRKKTLWLVLSLILVLFSAGWAWSGEESDDYAIMHPDDEIRMEWIRAYENAPRALSGERVKPGIPSPRGSLSLLSHLEYTPSARSQGSCGNCWVWAGTGVMAIALDVQEGIYDRLSIQYLNSCDTSYACCGGWLSDLADFCSDKGRTIPWSNTNASWQDGSSRCSDGESGVACEDISTLPRYPIESIETQTIITHGVGQAQAIANIKSVLDQNKAVWFAFFMGTADNWTAFRTFWNSQEGDVLWNFDSTCGEPYTTPGGGGHAVLCVGYNDDDWPANSYWIMLNSWGTTTDRPTGLFRVDMDMDYDCADDQGGHNLFWQTLDVDYGTAPAVTTGVASSITFSSATLNGTVNPSMESTTYYFEYGATTAYGSETASMDAGSGTGDVAVNVDITGLYVHTTYHYRIVATNSEGTTYGNDETFTTLAIPPMVTTGVAASVGLNTVTLGGTVNPNHSSTTYHFEYGATTAYGSATASMDAGSGTGDVSVRVDISGLSACTAYHYRIVATNTAGTIGGADKTFSTNCAEGGGGGGGCFISILRW